MTTAAPIRLLDVSTTGDLHVIVGKSPAIRTIPLTIDQRLDLIAKLALSMKEPR